MIRLDLDKIRDRAQYLHATSSGKALTVADDARMLVDEVQQLRDTLARVRAVLEDRSQRSSVQVATALAILDPEAWGWGAPTKETP